MTTPKIITSLTNDRVKAIRALEMRKVRKETGLFVAEGASLLVTARDNGFVPETLVYQAGTAASGITSGLVTHALNSGAEVLEVSAAVLAKLASKDNPQTLLGVFRQRFADPPIRRKSECRDVAGSRRGARSRQPRHDHPNCRCRRMLRRHPRRHDVRPLRPRVDSGDDGVHFRGADRQDGAAGFSGARQGSGAATSSERTLTGARIFAPRVIADRS